MNDIKNKILEETKSVERTVREKVLTYITAGLGFVVGLAWNDAIKSLIEYLFPLKENTILAKVIYAAILTIIVTAVIIYLERLLNRRAAEEAEK